MLGSLNVQALAMRSPRAGRRARRSGRSGRRSPGPSQPPRCGHPARGGEVVVGDDRVDAVLAARRAHPPVVVEGGRRELALLGLDAAPLDREAVPVEARGRRAGRCPRGSGGSGRRRRRSARARASPGVLPRPPVVVPVAALDLVGRGGGAPDEAVGERARRHGIVGRWPADHEGSRSHGAHPPRSLPGCRPVDQEAVDDLDRPARPRADRGQHLPGPSPDETAQRVFGGQVAGQALVAAARTVDADRRVHSLHAYFLRPGDPTVPILYEVDRIRDGRSFTTRRVVAIQHGRPIFNLSASFHVPRGGLRPPGPDARPTCPTPRRCPTSTTRLAPIVGQTSIGDVATTGPGPSTRATSTGRRPTAREPLPPRPAGSGCGPTASCPTTPCCTPACSPTPPT